jgi:hypothetical protein
MKKTIKYQTEANYLTTKDVVALIKGKTIRQVLADRELHGLCIMRGLVCDRQFTSNC